MPDSALVLVDDNLKENEWMECDDLKFIFSGFIGSFMDILKLLTLYGFSVSPILSATYILKPAIHWACDASADSSVFDSQIATGTPSKTSTRLRQDFPI